MSQKGSFYDIASHPAAGRTGEGVQIRRSESAVSAASRPSTSPGSSSLRYRQSVPGMAASSSHPIEPPHSSPGRVRCSSEMSADAETYAPVDPAFLMACREGDDNRIRQLMTSRTLTPDMVNFKDRTGKTGVSYICANGNIALLELISPIPSLDVNTADNEGNAPLHFATQAGHIDIVHHLLNLFNHIQLDQRNNLGFTPLMKAALQGRAKCVKLLLAAGASPLLRDYGRGFCACEWARFCGRTPCADVLEKFMKNANYSPAALHRQLRDLEKCSSEPNLQFFLPGGGSATDTGKDGAGWLRQKLKRAFHRPAHPDKPDYSLVGNLTNVALCASSPVVPTARVKGQSGSVVATTTNAPSNNNNHHGSVATTSSTCTADGRHQMALPKVEVTEANLCLDNCSTSGGHRKDKSNGVAIGGEYSSRCRSAK